MEKMTQDLFDDTTLGTEDGRVAGAICPAIACSTAIGGTVTRCISYNSACVAYDRWADTGQ